MFRLIFDAIWTNPLTRDSQDRVLMSHELLKSICIDAGLSDECASELMAHINDSETVNVLKRNVAEAVSSGAFGAPFMVVTPLGADEQVYFGSDRFEAMAFSIGKPWLGPDPQRPTAGIAKL
jgi:glutathione S-transferase kappa 1